MLLTVFTLILISLAAAICPAQTQKEEEYKISPRDKGELQRLSKHFVKRMQQTRDVGPLTAAFFVKDFSVLMGAQLAFSARQEHGVQLTPRQITQVAIASANYQYIWDLSYLVSDRYRLSDIFPNDLATILDDFPEWGEGAIDHDARLYKETLRRWRKAYSAANAELKKKNYEGSHAYKKAWAKRLKTGGYDYVVGSKLWDPDDTNQFEGEMSPQLKLKYPKGVREFYVSTPIGLYLVFIKDHGNFKILWVLPYPLD